MEIQYSSAIIKYEKILQLSFSFESREIISVGRLYLVNCRECGECYMLYTLQSFSAFFASNRGLFLLQEEILNSKFAIAKDYIWFDEKTFFQITLLGCQHCILA